MDIDTRLQQLADEYQIPIADLMETAALIVSVQKLPGPPTLRSQRQRMTRIRKRYPGNPKWWAVELPLLGERRVFNLTNNTRTIQKINMLRGRQPKRLQNIAIVGLAELWEHHRGAVPMYAGSAAFDFIISALYILDIERIMSNETLRYRLQRMR